MLQLKLKNTEGEILEVDFPETPSEILLSNKIAFDVCYENLLKWTKRELDDETFPENNTYYLYLCCRCVSEFLDINFSKVLKLDVGSLVDDDGNLLPNVLQEHIDAMNGNIEYDETSARVTLDKLLGMILQVTGRYERTKFTKENFHIKVPCVFHDDIDPKTGKPKIKEVEYTMPHLVKKMLTGKEVYTKVSTQQLVEIMKIKKYVYDINAQKRDPFADNTAVKDKRFTGFLKIMAITLNEPGVQIPLDDAGFDAAMEERLIRFTHVDMQTAYDVAFFLTSTILFSNHIPIANIFSTLPDQT